MKMLELQYEIYLKNFRKFNFVYIEKEKIPFMILLYKKYYLFKSEIEKFIVTDISCSLFDSPEAESKELLLKGCGFRCDIERVYSISGSIFAFEQEDELLAFLVLKFGLALIDEIKLKESYLIP